eukprot:c21008_g1_i1.p1 GENE.c21008_g1_i1~~c21008_g1_i1.p1  ORF type:complete len:343 (+),score=41.72 c21008_g1_i1:59-1087(+)
MAEGNNDLVSRVGDLERMIEGLITESNSRMSRIEMVVNELAKALARYDVPAPQSSPPWPAQIQQPQEISPPTPSFALRFDANIKTLWFSKRVFPPFTVTLINSLDQTVCMEGPSSVHIRLLTGHNDYRDHLLSTPDLTFPFVHGQASISGLRFGAVSSKNGNFFQLEANAMFQNTQLTCRSPHIRILSERLHNEYKATSVLELHSSSPLVRVPGIGKKYAKRMGELGYQTVGDLARVSFGDGSAEERERAVVLVAELSKEKGSLTEMKLKDLVREAKLVVTREGSGSSKRPQDSSIFSESPCAKRLRTEEDQLLFLSQTLDHEEPSHSFANLDNDDFLDLYQ